MRQLTPVEIHYIVSAASSIRERTCETHTGTGGFDSMAAARLERWSNVVADGDQGVFLQRLALENLSLASLGPVLSEDYRCAPDRALPMWAQTLVQVLESVDRQSLDNDDLDSDELAPHVQPFQDVLRPLIRFAHRKLMEVTRFDDSRLSSSAQRSLEYALLRRLSYLTSRTLHHMFFLFRVGKETSLDRLVSADRPGCRNQYKAFVGQMLHGDGLHRLFTEYPVLARLICIVIDSWVTTTAEFLTHLLADCDVLRQVFSPRSELGPVVSLETGVSDCHDGGRSVIIVSFQGGVKVVYKPRDLGLERSYYQLVDRLNQMNLPLSLTPLRIVDRTEYGWVEFVYRAPCESPAELGRYFQRVGIILCLLHTLGATDIHQENLIACGENPVLIDLETLLHQHAHPEVLDDPYDIQSAARYAVKTSVLGTGILPRWYITPTGESFDATALGGGGNQRIPFQKPAWKGINTDAMSMVLETVRMDRSISQPVLNSHAVTPGNYLCDIEDGFNRMHAFLERHREELCTDGGLLADMCKQRRRLVFRPTDIYISLLERTLHPKYLRNGADRNIEIDLLSRRFLTKRESDPGLSFFHKEASALYSFDVPRFTTSPASAVAMEPDPQSGAVACLNRLRTRLGELNESHRKRQIDLIRGSLYARFGGENALNHSKTGNGGTSSLTAELVLDTAKAIAEDLGSRAIWSSRRDATWLSPQWVMNARHYQILPLGDDLYEGRSGIALFLTALNLVQPRAVLREFLWAVLRPLITAVESQPETVIDKNGLGGISGAGSIIYSLAQIGRLLRDDRCLGAAQTLAGALTFEQIDDDSKLDVMEGVAGTCLGLLALHSTGIQKDVLEKAVACGRHLVTKRVASPHGPRAWATVKQRLLTGFSHGAAGIAHALIRLYGASGEAVFLAAAQEAIAYERSVFLAESRNWPDFRSSSAPDPATCQRFWCHGAPGIGLARVAAMDTIGSSEVREDVDAALATTLEQVFGENDDLCCGNLGRVEFLFTAARKLKDDELTERAKCNAAEVIHRAAGRGQFGHDGPPDTAHPFRPGFFQGVSGMGYQLLRLVYADLLPSILLLSDTV